MKLQLALIGCLLSTLCLITTTESAFSEGLPTGDLALSKPPLPAPNTESVNTRDSIPLRIAQANNEPLPPTQGKMQIEAQNPVTGETINIDINSNDLNYNSETGIYTVTGEVYIIIPEKSTEILADKAVYDPKASNMVATGHVFIIQNQRIIGSDLATYDLTQKFSTYKNFRSVTETARIRADSGERSDTFTKLHSGRIILTPEAISNLGNSVHREGFRLGKGAIYSYYSASRSGLLLQGEIGNLGTDTDPDEYHDNTSLYANTEDQAAAINPILNKPISPQDIAAADFSTGDSPYKFKTKRIDVRRMADGFDEITLKRSTFQYDNFFPIPTPFLDFGYQEQKKFLTYLGPDMGYDVDYGGFYAGPGWDTRFLNGWLRFSPIVSYGGGKRLRAHEGEPRQIDPQFGIGFLAHFRSPDNHTDFGYSSTLREPIFLMDQELFGRNQTRLRLGANQFYRNGFYGDERPRLIGEVVNASDFHPLNSWLLRTYATAGVAKDDFFPTRQSTFFVSPKSAEPITTTRFQLQGQLRPLNPLFYLGNFGAVGVLGQARVSAYGTGDTYGIFQGGPYVNLIGGPIFTQVRYLYGQTVGHTPFVFDSYYRGRNNLMSINSLDLGRFLTIGAVHELSLTRDNARKDLLVDQRFFISAGPKNFKFSLAYDFIQKRSFFGLTLNPQGGQMIMDFDNMNIYQPDYNPRMDNPTQSVLAPKKKPS